MSCNCECHQEDYHDYDDDEVSDFECPECGEELDEKGLCPNEECVEFECDPFDGVGGSDTYIDEQKWERQQMGITS